jgi:hypothetical protein
MGVHVAGWCACMAVLAYDRKPDWCTLMQGMCGRRSPMQQRCVPWMPTTRSRVTPSCSESSPCHLHSRRRTRARGEARGAREAQATRVAAEGSIAGQGRRMLGEMVTIGC